MNQELKIYPNPSDGNFFINNSKKSSILLKFTIVLAKSWKDKQQQRNLSVSKLNKGLFHENNGRFKIHN
jgi:hypothetical protein